MYNGSELRRHPRVPVVRPVRIRTSSGAIVQARSVNISVAGIAVLYPSPAEVGVTFELSFTLMVRGREVAFRERAVSVYNYLTSDGHVIGFQFAGPDASAAEALGEFVAFKRSLKDL